MHRFTLLSGLIVLLAILVGCSGTGTNPATPGIGNMTGSGSKTPASDQSLTSATNPQRRYLACAPALGALRWRCRAGGANDRCNSGKVGERAFERSQVSGAGGKAGGVQIASPLAWSQGNTVLDLDIRIVHPFPTMLEYSGFDVKGIFITKGTLTGFSDAGLTLANTGETRLLNPDGYTRWWNAREFIGGNDISRIETGRLA